MAAGKPDYLTLTQFLKSRHLTATGGQGKYFLLSHEVLVNGEPETRRGRKLRSGDTVTVDGKVYQVE